MVIGTVGCIVGIAFHFYHNASVIPEVISVEPVPSEKAESLTT